MDEGRQASEFFHAASQGGLFPLETAHSPESPTAWASFATGVNAGKHNIYDFLVRDTATYLPDLAMVKASRHDFSSIDPVRSAEVRLDSRRHVVLGDCGSRGVRPAF